MLPGALAAAGFDVVPHDRHFAVDTPDELWIAEVGRRGWVMLSQDYMILRRSAQRDAVMRAGARLDLLPPRSLCCALDEAASARSGRARRDEAQLSIMAVPIEVPALQIGSRATD
jgi:hypothetical protein